MSISTLQTIQLSQKPKFSNILLYASAVLIILILIFFGKNILESAKKLGGKSALTIDVSTSRAEVYVNDQMVGVTPFESKDIKPGNNKIKVKSSDRQYETTINFLSNNSKYIHSVNIFRDFGISDLYSSGQDVWFDENTSGNVLRIIADPDDSNVFIDNTEIGKTPYTSSKLTEGDYDIRIEHNGYEPQKVRIKIINGYTSNVAVKLFPIPVPSKVSKFEGSPDLFDVSSDNNLITSDTNSWVKAVVYWNQTRGINLEGTGQNKELIFDYFVDYKGTLFDQLGDPITQENLVKLAAAKRGAYLGRVSDGPTLSQAATDAIKASKNLTTTDTAAKTVVKILQTGTGWLRVRNAPNVTGTEIARVTVGNEYPVLEVQSEWVKITAENNIQGWVSKTYTQMIENKVQTQNTQTTPTVQGGLPVKANSGDTTNIISGSLPGTKTL